MSILQDFESARKIIGEEKWNSFDDYIKLNPNLLLDQIIYNKNNYEDFERWFYKIRKHQKVEILGIWQSDYDDIRCDAILYKDNKVVANIIASEEIVEMNNNTDFKIDENIIKEKFKRKINEDFDKYISLPKISECSNLLTQIYDNVCDSDSTMCHIDQKDWDLEYSDEYSEEDIDELQKEIIKYGLENIITMDDDGYKIVGYGDLETRFNDDRNFEKELYFLSKCNDYNLLSEKLSKKQLDNIDKVLGEFTDYESKYDDGDIDIIEKYIYECGNGNIVEWYEGIKSIEDFLQDYLSDEKGGIDI